MSVFSIISMLRVKSLVISMLIRLRRWWVCVFSVEWLDGNGGEVSSTTVQETTGPAACHSQSHWWNSHVCARWQPRLWSVGLYVLTSLQCKIQLCSSYMY